MITGIADIAREVDERAFDAFGESELWEKAQGKGKKEIGVVVLA